MDDSSLKDFVEQVSGRSRSRIEEDFGGGFVRLHASEADRRQAAQDISCSEDAVRELLRNSRDAGARMIFVASSKSAERRVITVVDDGGGIPESMFERIFEPRVTSKLDSAHRDAWGFHGRGMALFSIKQNANSASVRSSAPGKGASLRVELDPSRVGERKDQSTFPTIALGEANVASVRGPRNIARTVLEFALECRGECRVHLGSPAEISSALYRHGMASLSELDRLFCADASGLDVTQRLAIAADPDEFSSLAKSLGLDMSDRTARRIMDGQIQPAPQILDLVTIEGQASGSRKKRRAGKGRAKLRLTAQDRESLANSVRDCFGPIANAYYLESDIQPAVTVGSERVTVSIPIVPKS